MTSLTTKSPAYRPFHYPWAVDFAVQHERIHWIESDIELKDDVSQWAKVATSKFDEGLTPSEKNQITQILKLFTQSDVEVAGNYANTFVPFFKNNEIRMMLVSIASREAIHARCYALLNDTLGLDEREYWSFRAIPEMMDKVDFMNSERFVGNSQTPAPRDMALALAQTVVNEGVGLFSSFAILLNHTRRGKMKGMGKVVEYSIRDENLHAEAMTRLFREFVEVDHPEIIDDEFKKEIYDMFRNAIEIEDKVIELAFEIDDIEGLSKSDMQMYIRYMGDIRLKGLGLKPNWGVSTNPLPWMDEQMAAYKLTNFFENRSAEYSKNGGTDDDYFD